jgi:hypothetical protein
LLVFCLVFRRGAGGGGGGGGGGEGSGSTLSTQGVTVAGRTGSTFFFSFL